VTKTKQAPAPDAQTERKRRLSTSLLLFLVALLSITAATVAWFTIADRTLVRAMNMEVTSGANLRFDLDAHSRFEQYVKTLYFSQISQRISQEQGFDMQEVPLEPVTTEDVETFTLENGTVVESDSGAYLTFTLHFMAAQDMLVHLTSASTAGSSDGTAITSSASTLPSAMRISFTADGVTYVYDPGLGDTSTEESYGKTFGLADGSQMVLSDDNAMFYLKAEVDKPVVVHVWLEGTDENCTDDLRGADYSIRLRFVGTDEENNLLDGADYGPNDSDDNEPEASES
jgi:hypothetical protein